jgi:hypothetical protein
VLSDTCFQDFFDGIGEFHSSVREELYAVVVKRVVRGGDDHAGLKIILANEAGDAGSGDNASERDGSAALGQAGGEDRGDVWARFAGVHADEDASRANLAKEISSERATGGKESSVVKRRGAGDAADTVGAEKFFGHSGKPINPALNGAEESKVSLAYGGMAGRNGTKVVPKRKRKVKVAAGKMDDELPAFECG